LYLLTVSPGAAGHGDFVAAYVVDKLPILLAIPASAFGLLFLSHWLQHRYGFGERLGSLFWPVSFRGRSPSAPAGSIRHVRSIKSAHRALRAIHKIDPRRHPASAFKYLRAVSLRVFEEMILLEIARRGQKVQPVDHDSDGGGIDGRFSFGEQGWLMQARRYSGDVNADHIWNFAAICEEEAARGLFVHTGRTPQAVRARAKQSTRVTIVSGDALVALFAGEPLRLVPEVTPPVAPADRAESRSRFSVVDRPAAPPD
jgi:restriction system protein